MGKGINLIYKYDQRNWPYPYPNTTFFIPQRSDTSIETKRTSDSYSPVGAHNLESFVLYQSTNHHGNTDVNVNDDSKSFETPRRNIAVLPVLVIKSPQQLHHINPHIIHLEKSIYV